MKKRILSSIIMAIILVPLFLKGGIVFTLGVYFISLLALKEFLDMKNTKKEHPEFINFISYMMLTLLIFFNVSGEHSKEILVLTMDFRVVAGLFLTFLIPTVLYHDRSKYSINDAFYLIGGIFFLGTSVSLFILFREREFALLIYLLLITIFTDTYAFLTGLLIGKHKLLEEISPKKTWKGTLGGTIFAVFVAVSFYHTVINPETSIWSLTLITTFLSFLGQLGDLFFSAIKRYYGKKDFSNIIPGHGGILDRLDSIIFVVLGYVFFISIL
ncbi:MAG: phosphatidate cytidylyltransferase [Bacilli bacterium]|nr:phosphatidate cytidylyltransferase [Bacilli bacterium]